MLLTFALSPRAEGDKVWMSSDQGPEMVLGITLEKSL